jgi:hypothetical protein
MDGGRPVSDDTARLLLKRFKTGELKVGRRR